MICRASATVATGAVVPGMIGTPARSISSRTRVFEPIASIADAGGPMHRHSRQPLPRRADIFENGEPTVERVYGIEVSGKCFGVKVVGLREPMGHIAAAGPDVAPGRPKQRDRVSTSGVSDGALAPLQGTITMVAVELDAPVSAGALVCVIESMKMENEIRAHRTGTIAGLLAVVGSSVAPGDTLA